MYFGLKRANFARETRAFELRGFITIERSFEGWLLLDQLSEPFRGLYNLIIGSRQERAILDFPWNLKFACIQRGTAAYATYVNATRAVDKGDCGVYEYWSCEKDLDPK